MPQPYIKFYLRDWEADAQLVSCSLAARGLWVHMLRVMEEADPFGFFVGRCGEPIDIVAFAKRIVAKPTEVRKLMVELESHGVPSRDEANRLYCRRMVRQFAKSLQAAEFGALGGNPMLIPGLKPMDNPTVKPRDKASHKPNARDHSHSHSQNSDSLRSSATAFGRWPEQADRLRALALLFVAEFANCRDAARAEKQIGPYGATLAAMRSRGVTIEQGWKACAEAREVCGRPLFGAAVKSALSFLPARLPNTARDVGYRTYRPGESDD